MVLQDIDVDDIEDADDKDSSMEWMDGVARYRKILHVCKLAAGAEEEKGRAAKGKYDLAVRSVMIGDDWWWLGEMANVISWVNTCDWQWVIGRHIDA